MAMISKEKVQVNFLRGGHHTVKDLSHQEYNDITKQLQQTDLPFLHIRGTWHQVKGISYVSFIKYEENDFKDE